MGDQPQEALGVLLCFGLYLRRATRSARSVRGSGFEKQRVKFILAHHSAKLPEGEEGNEGAEDDDRLADQIVDVDIVHDSSSRQAVNEALDELLDEVEGEDKQAEDE